MEELYDPEKTQASHGVPLRRLFGSLALKRGS
jgi:hypothetical protein